MKISNETKVGVLTIVSLVILILGFNFLKGKELLKKEFRLYAIFDKVGALSKSNEVKINGLTVGKVDAIEETDKTVSSIKVTIHLTKDIDIPSNSTAYISAPLGGLGSAVVLVEKGDAKTYLKNGDRLSTGIDEGFFGGLASEVGPTLSKIRNTLDSLNRVFGNINKLFDSQTKGNLQQSIANMNAATYSLTRLLDPNSGDLARSLSNVSSITDNLRRNNDSITATISYAKQFGEKLSRVEIQPIADSLQIAISQLKASIAKISSNEGTLGALIHDRALYNKLNDVALSMEILLDDLRAHPKRYVNLSIFGRRDRDGALNSPLKKDTLPK